MRPKITVVGAGNVGANSALACLQKKLGDVVLVDVAEGIAKGKALDMMQACALQNHACTIIGTADYADTANSDVILITAGIPRKPGMSRDDLIKTNMEIVTSVVKAAVAHSPNAVIIVVSNPLDVICRVAHKASGLPAERVIGLSGVLDTARLRYMIAQHANVPIHTVSALVIGEHGDSMVPLPRLATVGGVPAPGIFSPEQLRQLAEDTTKGGAAIVALMGTSAFYGPGYAAAVMIEAILTNSNAILPCSAYLNGQYGAEDMFMCVPVRLGKTGIQEIINIPLNPDETKAIAHSVASIREKLQAANIG